MRNRTRIAHLSDIHFGMFFDLSVWTSVKQAIAEAQPDLIVVSGDFVQSPFPLMLILARRELDQFCKSLGKPWFAVPGNHDVAVYGNIRVWPFTRLFSSIFSRKLDDKEWLQKYPTYSEFYGDHSWVFRLFVRLWLYVKFLICFHWLRIPWKSTVLPDRYSLKEPVPVELFGLDSNRSFFLAAGKVRRAQITGLGTQLRELNTRKRACEAMIYRIIVLHHHAVPIPYAPESVTSFEPFLVLRDGGTLLNELWLHDVDLILHGHRHLANFSRIAYGGVQNNPRTIPVLAAASPTVKGPRAGNSFNLLDLYANGRMSVTPICFGGGVTIKGTSERDSIPFDALSVEEVKIRSFQRSKRVAGRLCKEFRRHVYIGDLGDTRTLMRIEGLEVVGDQLITDQEHEFTFDLAKLDPANVRLFDSTPSIYIKSITPEHEPSSKVVVKIGMPTLGRGVVVSYGLEYYIWNNFRLSEWECKRIHPAQFEYASVRVRFPWRRLRFSIELPTLLLDARPTLRCYRPSDYPNLEIDPVTNDVLLPAKIEWHLDTDITDYEKDNLVEVLPHQWEAIVAYPLLGYKYAIEWTVRDIREARVNPRYSGETEAVRRAAVVYRARRIGSASQVDGTLRRVLELLLEEFRKRFGVQNMGQEVLRACLFSFDDSVDGEMSETSVNPNVIVAIEEVVLGTQVGTSDLEDWTMEYGGGVAGLSFKTAYPQIYFEPAIRLGQRAAGGYFPLANRLSLEAVLAIPLYHPVAWEAVANGRGEMNEEIDFEELPSTFEVMGVLTFASDSPGSQIGVLYDENLSKAERMRLVFEFLDIVQKTSQSIVNSLMQCPLSS